MIDSVLRVSGPDIVFEDFDGDLVVLNITSGQYFGFNGTAAIAWAALMEGVKPRDLIAAGLPQEDVEAFVARLDNLGLVKPTDEAGTAIGDAARTDLAAQTQAPQVDAYDDLSDLILADPIHDVDEEAGWPAVSAAE